MRSQMPAAEQARREIADCDAKLRQHRAAIEAGADPAVIARWMAETQARRAEAETRLRPDPRRQVLTTDQIASRIAEIGDIPSALAAAQPDDKAQLYSELGLTMIYDPSASAVRVTARPLSSMYVKGCPRGDLNANPREISPDRGFHADNAIPAIPAKTPSFIESFGPLSDSTLTRSNLHLGFPRPLPHRGTSCSNRHRSRAVTAPAARPGRAWR